MKNFHGLNATSNFNESEEKSDVLEAEKLYEPINVKCDLSENEENILSKDEEVDESNCDMIENINIFYSGKDGIFAAEQHTDDPNGFQTKQEVDSDKSDQHEEDTQDSKCFVNEFVDPEGKIWNREDDFSQNRIQHLDHLNTVKSEPPDFGMQSGCDEKMNEKTDGSDDIEDSKFFVQQYLDEEGKLWDNKDTISTKVIGTTQCSQQTTLVASEPLEMGMQSGCDEIMNEETNVSEDETEDSKCFIHQYLDDEGKFFNNIDANSLKKEDAARELHQNELLENEDAREINFGATRSSNLNYHIDSVHLKVKKYKCHLCDYSTAYKSNLKYHIDSVHLKVKRERIHKCHLCDYSTAKSGDLNRHVDSVHLKAKREKTQKCHLCDYNSFPRGNLKGHIENVHLKVKKHKCHLCEFSFTRKVFLKRHIDIVHLKVEIEKKHKCHWCDYACEKGCDLNRHIDGVHLNVKKHKCHFCDYRTANSGGLNRHIDSVHLKVKIEKKHNCHFCEYSTAYNGALKRHIDSVHLKVKKHKCDLCDYTSAYNSGLKYHIENVHLKVDREIEKNHKCHLCDYRAAKSHDLNRHIDSVHLKLKKHKCHLCDYTSVYKNVLKCHIDNVHLKVEKEKKHKCLLCNFSSVKSSDLHRHIKRVHLKLNKP